MAATYSPALHCSTIGANGLNFSVRNRKGLSLDRIKSKVYTVETALSRDIISGRIGEGQTVRIDFDGTDFTFDPDTWS